LSSNSTSMIEKLSRYFRTAEHLIHPTFLMIYKLNRNRLYWTWKLINRDTFGLLLFDFVGPRWPFFANSSQSEFWRLFSLAYDLGRSGVHSIGHSVFVPCSKASCTVSFRMADPGTKVRLLMIFSNAPMELNYFECKALAVPAWSLAPETSG
jgi:hypothetical protein